MVDSVHAVKWLSRFSSRNLEFLIFPSGPHRRVHPELKTLLHGNSAAKYTLVKGQKLLGLPLWALDKLAFNRIRGAFLSYSIRKFSPNYIHAMELQNAGYLVLSAMGQGLRGHHQLISTNWGSDIYWFRKYPNHLVKLKKLMQISDFYSAECQRDYNLAVELGFQGKFLPKVPNSGGFTSESLSIRGLPISQRNVIAIKGYQGWVGRASVALAAIEEMSDELAEFKIRVFSANLATIHQCRGIVARTGLDIVCHRKNSLSHTEIMSLMGQSRIYLGVSESDGISTSMMEAMAMGAIPVQTHTSCCDEWFSTSGVSIRKITIEEVKKSVRRGLELSKDKQHAALNRLTIESRASVESIQPELAQFYCDRQQADGG